MSAIEYQFKRDFNELDEDVKDEQWANRLITEFRRNMVRLVDINRAKINRSYLLGEQSMEKHMKKFAKPKEMPFEFTPLGSFEKTRNILTAERQKAGIYLQLKAEDPTAQTEREYDTKLLQNSSFIEQMLSYAQLAIGLPAYKISADKGIGEEKIAKGNLENFQELGLDPNSPEDIAYFMKTHYRLDIEIEAEDVVNYFVKFNELKEYINDWCDDIIAVKAIAGRVYADEYTFTPKYQYLPPENVSWVKGYRRDGKDAQAIMSEENMTIGDFLGKVGSALKLEDMIQVLQASQFTYGGVYDGISFSNGSVYPASATATCSYNDFLGLKIAVGYIEWKSVNAKARKIGVNALGNLKIYDRPIEWDPQETNSTYRKESIYTMVTYKSYFISTTSMTQRLFKFGRLFDMHTDGPEDEYSSYSFQVYQQTGKSAIDIAIPHIDNIHDAWFRFNWILNKAKPKGTRYNYTVIANIARMMFKETADHNGVMKVIKMFHEGIDDFYVSDGMNKNSGGGQDPHFEKKNGLDETIKDLYQVIIDQQSQINEKLGINEIRDAVSPNPNDGYKLQMQSLAQSRNATDYISHMIMSLLVNYAKHTVCIVQDMIEFKGSKSYEVIERAVGIKAIKTLQTLKKMPLHKFGIFVESFNTDMERMQMKQEAQDAWQKGEIPYHVYIMIRSMNNIKKAAQILAYEKGNEIKRKREDEKRAHDNAMALAKQQHDYAMAKQDGEYDGKNRVMETKVKGDIRVAELNNEADLQIKRESLGAEPMKADVRAKGKIQQDEAAARIKRGEPTEMTEV